MAKFKKGDRVRRVSGVILPCDMTPIGGINVVDENDTDTPYALNKSGHGGRSVIDERDYELATPEPIPDTVTIGGVEYVRKPERDHIWAWGQWARVNEGAAYEGETVFILGEIDEEGWVPFSFIGAGGFRNTDGHKPHRLTYIGTATIPE